MRWLELSVEADVEAVEAVSEILGRHAGGTAVHPTSLVRDPDDELAARPDPSTPFVVTAHLEAGPSASASVAEAERALWHLQAFGLRPVGELQVREVDDVDWIDAWKAHHVVQTIGRLVIVPSWLEHDAAAGEHTVILDPGMAFGTGLHPTTRACLEELDRIDRLPARVLDVGCGSGVLGLAALARGAEHVVGLDTDPAAIDATRSNAARNGVADRFEARLGSLPAVPDARYPLILANLVAVVLVELAPRLAAHLEPGGTLIASGVIDTRADEVVAALEAATLHPIERRDAGEWVTLRMSRTA